MKVSAAGRLVLCCSMLTVAVVAAEDQPRPYRLQSISMQDRVLWGAQLRESEGNGLAFGGQDQLADDGRPHTRVLVDGQWQAIHQELRKKNPLQAIHAAVWKLRGEVKKAMAYARHVYFDGVPLAEQKALIREKIAPQLAASLNEMKSLAAKLAASHDDPYFACQARFAVEHLEKAASTLPTFDDRITADALRRWHEAQIQLELAAEALDAEPAPRAMQCGVPHRDARSTNPPANTLVYDAKTKLYLIFGGDHLDYLTNDTWVFDPAKRRWEHRHPRLAPPPRANHRLTAMGDGTVRMTGGYVYTSNTDYVGGQYRDLRDGEWGYDIAANQWSPAGRNSSEMVAEDSRDYRTGPFHPQHFIAGEAPDAAKFQAWLRELPANQWMAVNPEKRPELNRDWGVARIDADRDVMLRWSGGHSAHGGSDVPHFHFATGRWELPFPVEFPLGQLYVNTEYPSGFNFNLRPWVTGHTYQNYDYDPPSKTMVFTGQDRDFFIYDPAVADWIAKAEKPKAMRYNSCFYTLTLATTPHGAMCWDQNGRVHRYEHQSRSWVEPELSGDRLPGAHVDNSSIVYDSHRDRLLIINTLGYNKPFDGQVWAVDIKNGEVKKLWPAGMKLADRFATIDKSCYDADNDLLLLGSYLKDGSGHTPTPAYDCATNRWVLLDLAYEVEKRNSSTRRRFPNDRSDALMHDAKRKRIWGCDTNGQVYVLRLDAAKANIRPLQ